MPGEEGEECGRNFIVELPLERNSKITKKNFENKINYIN